MDRRTLQRAIAGVPLRPSTIQRLRVAMAARDVDASETEPVACAIALPSAGGDA